MTATVEPQRRITTEPLPTVRAALRRPGMTRRGSCGSRRTLFAVSFRSPMSDLDVRHLAAVAGLDCDLHPKLRGTTVSPGVRRLDFASGLFLVRGARDGEWRLEGRTWGSPAAGAVHRWHVWAATAVQSLDPNVPVPTRDAGVLSRRIS